MSVDFVELEMFVEARGASGNEYAVADADETVAVLLAALDRAFPTREELRRPR